MPAWANVLINLAVTAGLGYGAARASGLDNKAALAAALAAALGNQSGLHQTPPSKR